MCRAHSEHARGTSGNIPVPHFHTTPSTVNWPSRGPLSPDRVKSSGSSRAIVAISGAIPVRLRRLEARVTGEASRRRSIVGRGGAGRGVTWPENHRASTYCHRESLTEPGRRGPTRAAAGWWWGGEGDRLLAGSQAVFSEDNCRRERHNCANVGDVSTLRHR